MPTPSRFIPRLLALATGALWLFLFVMTHIPQGHTPDIQVNDKIEHFLAYGILAGMLFVTLWVSRPGDWRLALLSPLIVIAYGAVDEWLQAVPFIRRSCEMADWIADVIGVVLAMVILIPARMAWERCRRTEPERVDVKG